MKKMSIIFFILFIMFLPLYGENRESIFDAIESNNLDKVKKLVEGGADVNATAEIWYNDAKIVV